MNNDIKTLSLHDEIGALSCPYKTEAEIVAWDQALIAALRIVRQHEAPNPTWKCCEKMVMQAGNRICCGEPLEAAPASNPDLIRFDFINADGNEDSKVISHDEMRQRYASAYAGAMKTFGAPASSAMAMQRYRLLESTDIIQADDEFIDDDGVRWMPISGWEVGMRYCNALKSGRRKIGSSQPSPVQPIDSAKPCKKEIVESGAEIIPKSCPRCGLRMQCYSGAIDAGSQS